MIERPRRAVTRFFIPLIDVLILLFCIFLLMPFVSVPTPPEAADPSKPFERPDPKPLPSTVTELQRELAQAQRDIKRLTQGKTNLADRLSVRVLDIDPKDGRLYYYYDWERREVKDEREARRVIDLQQRLAGTREPFFLILYPRERSGFPTPQQRREIGRWFQGVQFGFETPFQATAQ